MKFASQSVAWHFRFCAGGRALEADAPWHFIFAQSDHAADRPRALASVFQSGISLTAHRINPLRSICI